MASIHVSPSFLKPRALAGTLTPSGLDSLPPGFAPCWKAPHHARGTLGGRSHRLPGFSPLRLGKSSIAKNALPSAPAERSNHRLHEQASPRSPREGCTLGSPASPPSGARGPLALLGLLLCLHEVWPLAALHPLLNCISCPPTSIPNF